MEKAKSLSSSRESETARCSGFATETRHVQSPHHAVEIPDRTAARVRRTAMRLPRCWSTSQPRSRRSARSRRRVRSTATAARWTRQNVQGETQKQLDVLANEIFLRHCDWGGHVAGMASEEMEEPFDDSGRISARPLPAAVRSARRLVEHRRQCRGRHDLLGAACTTATTPRLEADFLQPGTARSRAGYAIYGPSTMLVLTSARARTASRSIRRSATSS